MQEQLVGERDGWLSCSRCVELLYDTRGDRMFFIAVDNCFHKT